MASIVQLPNTSLASIAPFLPVQPATLLPELARTVLLVFWMLFLIHVDERFEVVILGIQSFMVVHRFIVVLK